MSDDNTCPCGRPAAECVLPHCPGEPTESGMNEGYLEMMQAHIDDDGKLSHLNGLDLLKEVYRLRRLLRRASRISNGEGT